MSRSTVTGPVMPVQASLLEEYRRAKPVEAESPSEEEKLRRAIQQLQSSLGALPMGVEFEIRPDLSSVIMMVRDGNGSRVVREMAPDEVMRLAQLVKSGRQHLLDRLV
ncbi:MAG: flagellar protein FlaG [Deltaproteobacteria bacterium]|nr:flagellar protein FlaG [Deltaproteobacteria bacterium]